MILPIPSGTRDVLPDEMGELRTLNGEALVLRSDMTVPIARLVGSRYQASEPPLRFAYFAHCYRGVRPQRGQPREFLQAGIELIGAAAPAGTAEAVTVLCRALDRAGLARYRVGIGDAALYPALMDALEVPDERRGRLLSELGHGDFVGLENALADLAIDERSLELLLSVPQLRGGPEILHGPPGPVADAVAGLRAIHQLLAADVAERVIFDLGLSRAPGYYTGAVFEVYDPAVGMPIGGGGRYDHLLGQFGRELPAVGFALEVEKLHQALAAEERLAAAAP
jgi:ATP phosphoribosyltransferase regulatory subunit